MTLQLWIILVFIAILWLSVRILRKRERKNKYPPPPGPMKLPFFGNLFHLASSPFPFIAFDNLSQKYGKIMSIQMGAVETIVLSAPDVLKSILAREEVQERDTSDYITERNFGKGGGIGWNRGKEWKDVRKFVVTTLKKFGFEKPGPLELVVGAEVENTIQNIKKQMHDNNGIVQENEVFMTSAVNVIHLFATGERLSDNDPKLHQLAHLNNAWFKAISLGASVTLAFPFFRDMFPRLSGKNIYLNTVQQLHQYFQDLIRKYESKFNPNSEPQNLLQALLKRRNEESRLPDPCYTDEQIIVIFLDLFQAGAETVGTVLTWLLLHLILNPRVQEKIHEEIDSVIPKGVKPDLSYKERMVYVWAFIYESMRFNVTAPIPALRMVTKDFVCDGLYFKKGTSVISNIYSAAKNKDAWGDPENFRPERFLQPNGALDEELIQKTSFFGYGNRACMGDKLAMNQLFLFVTSLLQQMSFKPVPGQPEPTLDVQMGLTAQPLPYSMLVEMRK